MDKGNYILIVEDSNTQAGQIEAVVKDLGHEIVLACNGEEAYGIIKKKKPLAVISDILMPLMDGYQLCRLIKTDLSLKDIPVVLLTQLSDPQEIIKGLECGADDFIVKPYSEDLLLTRIQSIVSLKLKQDFRSRQITVLIVEDSPTQSEQLKYLLEDQGYRVIAAENGKEGLELAKRQKPTIIVSDILMPVMDGYEFAYELKKDPELKNIPIILITSILDRKDIVKKASVVANGFFTKPYDEAYLLKKIDSLLNRGEIGLIEEDSQSLEVTFEGERYVISSGKRKILNFLLSIYENAIQQNRDLLLTQRELKTLNEQLEERVVERTRQLQATEAKYRTLLETKPDAIVVVGEDGGIYFVNKAAEQVFQSDGKDLSKRLLGFQLTPGAIKDVVINADGKEAVAEMRVAETTWGEEKAVIATFRDITGRKQMEQALRESEENFRALADNANDGLFILMEKGRVVYANKRASELTGYASEELPGKTIEDLVHPDILPFAKANFNRALSGIGNQGYLECLLSRRDGKEMPVECNLSKTTWQGQNAAIVLFHDITERKKREEELIRAGKLESLGTLAGGIAHDFNNLLTGIVGNASLAKVLTNPSDKIYKIISDLEKASLRAKDLTQQLLTFAKGGAPVKKTSSIKELIRDSAAFALTGSNIKCEYMIPENIWQAEIDEGQISQVIHNLVLNSVQAMKNGGTIRVLLENVNLGSDANLPLTPGKYVRIRIKDTGEGISKANLSKIFDPYFTTKPDGTGLGLATVYSIIKNHDGHISVDSEINSGTTFQIYLPASQKEVQSPASSVEKLVTGEGRILIMDDEEIIRDAAGSILTELGYDVDFAVNGEEAVEMYRKLTETGKSYDAVIMDLTIPGGMGGREAVKKLLGIDPGAKAIVSSGYSEDSIMSEYRKYGFRAVIAKPYKIIDLSSTVHKVVTGNS